jgi:4-aminobutyrate aminotransferase/(S)-3-amino-2-methylpropionate transaminase
VIGRAKVMDAPAPGGLGGTYGGNPLACAAGLAVLDIFEQEHLVERAAQLGQRLMERCLALQSEVPEIGDVRGLGPMIGMELVHDPETNEPAPDLADQVLAQAREQGLLLIKAGLHGNVVRILVPLVIEEPLLSRAIDTLCTVIKQVTQQSKRGN